MIIIKVYIVRALDMHTTVRLRPGRTIGDVKRVSGRRDICICMCMCIYTYTHLSLSRSHSPSLSLSIYIYIYIERERCIHTHIGDDTVGNPHRARISRFELFELVLRLKLDKHFPVEQFEATVSQSAVPSPHAKSNSNNDSFINGNNSNNNDNNDNTNNDSTTSITNDNTLRSWP